MTDIMHTFAYAIINGDGFLMIDTNSGRGYIFGSEEQAKASLAKLTLDDPDDIHVCLIAIVPVNPDGEDMFEEVLGEDDDPPDEPWRG